METVEITAGRLHLRPWRAYDADAVLAACSDPLTQRWTTVPAPYTRADAVGWVERIAPAGWEVGETATFAVLDAFSGEVLASVGLSGLKHDPEVGYWCAPEARGQGVVTEATGAVCRWGFAALDLPRISWTAEVGNVASRAVAEKCGFTIEGTARGSLVHRGDRVDAWTGGLLRDDEVVDRRLLPAPPVLSDGVVTLRGWRTDDAAAVARAAADPELQRRLPDPSRYARDGGAFYVGTSVPTRWAAGTVAELAVTVDGQVAGGVVLMLTHRALGIGEVGYWTAPWARGRGVAGRAAALMAGWAFTLSLGRVELLAETGNAASQRVAEKAGFVREGTARSGRADLLDPTARVDMAVYSKLP